MEISTAGEHDCADRNANAGNADSSGSCIININVGRGDGPEEWQTHPRMHELGHGDLTLPGPGAASRVPAFVYMFSYTRIFVHARAIRLKPTKIRGLQQGSRPKFDINPSLHLLPQSMKVTL